MAGSASSTTADPRHRGARRRWWLVLKAAAGASVSGFRRGAAELRVKLMAIRAEPATVSLALERAVPSQRGLPVLLRRCREAATQVPLTQPSVAQRTLGSRC